MENNINKKRIAFMEYMINKSVRKLKEKKQFILRINSLIDQYPTNEVQF